MKRRRFLKTLASTIAVPLFVPDNALRSILWRRTPGNMLLPVPAKMPYVEWVHHGGRITRAPIVETDLTEFATITYRTLAIPRDFFRDVREARLFAPSDELVLTGDTFLPNGLTVRMPDEMTYAGTRLTIKPDFVEATKKTLDNIVHNRPKPKPPHGGLISSMSTAYTDGTSYYDD